MQTRKRWLSIILVLATFISVLFVAGINVSAETVTDGISVSVSSDKAEYDSGDEVKLEITVKNTNDFEVGNLRIENILPDGIKLVSGNAVEENVTLKAEEEKIVKLSVAKAQVNNGTTSSTSSTPKTGESGIITILLAVLLIAGVVIVFALKGKKGCKFFSVVLCLCLIGQLSPETLVNAQNSTSEDSMSSLTAECTYTIDGTEYLHKVVISYENVDAYSEVNIELQELLTNDVFINGSVEERKEIVEEILDKLENANLIMRGSVEYNSQRECFYFNYLDGGEGSIMLSGYSDNKNNSKDEYFIDPNTGFIVNLETEGISNTNEDIEYIPSGTAEANGYIKEYLENQNIAYSQKTAIIIDELNDNSERTNFNKFKETWSSNGLKTVVKSNVTGEEFKTILNGENGHGGYDFINIRAHGYVDADNNPTVALHETWSFIYSGKYSNDIKNKRIGVVVCKDGLCYYLKPSFFEHYYSKKLIDTIVVLGCCEGYVNDKLVSTLANDCGAKSVIAPTDTVYMWYNTVMTDTLVHQLLLGSTIEEALNENKSSLGKDDEEFIVKMGRTPENTPAEWKIYNGGNETLVELERLNNNGILSGTVTDENGNPIKGAEIGITNIRGQSFETTAITDDNGKYTLECIADSYKITAKATGYSIFESDKFIDVVYGEETTYNITLKKDSEEVPQLPAIVKTVYENQEIWLDDINKLASEYSDVQSGYYNECWFQDLDMDGTPEFIVGGMKVGFIDWYSYVYHIYKYDNGELKRVKINNFDGYGSSYVDDEHLLEIYWGESELGYGSQAFKQLQTFRDENTGKYLHTLTRSDYNYEGCTVSFSSYNMIGTEFMTDIADMVHWRLDQNDSIVDSVDRDAIISSYDNYFADLTPYKTTIKPIPCSDESIDIPNNYDQMTDEEKKQALLDSYNAWSYEVDTNAELPLESYIDKLREISDDEFTENYLKYNLFLYGDKGNICVWEYADYDGDGKKEAFAITGTDNMPDYYVSDSIEAVYFVSSDGDVTDITPENSNGLMCVTSGSADCSDKKFFSYKATAGGSGSQTYLFGVKNGTCYELNISGSIDDFYSRDNKFYATISEIQSDGGHVWSEVELIYEEDSQEFLMGDKTGNYY